MSEAPVTVEDLWSRDHDLLVRLDTKLDGLSSHFLDVRRMLNSKADAARVEKLERQIEEIQTKAIAAKADAVRVEKLELVASLKADAARVEKLENIVSAINNKIYIATGALSAIQVGIHLLWK
jgi:polyhydroxyalkanoate synthesis regulator phasin